jgi:hypothetical protein
MKKEEHESRNLLTEHETNYRRYNPEIIDAFASLHPATLSKLSIIIFNIIMETKRHRKSNHRYFSEQEDKRIYNNKFISLESLLDRCFPGKYKVEGKDQNKDLSNLSKRLQDLDDQNIFYIWKFGHPYTYMFILERDLGLWKHFNPKSVVIPKTLIKITKASGGIIDTMLKLEKSRKKNSTLREIEASFLNDFFNKLILKMSPEVSKRITKWDDSIDIPEYFKTVLKQLETMDEYEGLVEDETFYSRIPQHLQEKMINKREKNMDIQQLEKDLVPDDDDVTPLMKVKKNKKVRKPASLEPDRLGFKSVNPFLNCNEFMRYYRGLIRDYSNDAKFYDFNSERNFATLTLDTLKENRKVNKDFLRSWIQYYASAYLKGNNISKLEKTSIGNFIKTFEEYNGKYFEV